MLRRFIFLFAFATLTPLACAPATETPSSSAGGNTGTAGAPGSGGGGEGGSGGEAGSGGATSAGGEGGLGGFGGQGGGPAVDETEVFGHSAWTLYKLHPITKEVTTVGDFVDCTTDVIDIALDKDGHMVGTTFAGLYNIDKKTAQCSLIAAGQYPNSLSFVPEGTVDAGAEALVGFEKSTYVRIFTDTGEKQTIGTLDGGYESSGDLVSVIGGGTYLTVLGGPENCGDCIIEVNPTTGAFVKNVGPLGHPKVFGLAFWGGVAYGFDGQGKLFQIDLTTALTTDIPLAGVPSLLSFYGAGSTTAAALEPPK